MNSNRKTSIKASNLQLRSDHTVVSLNASLMSSETKLGNQTESSTRGEKYKESREDKHDMKRYKDDITSRSRGETIFWDRDVFEFPLLEATAAKMKAIQEKRKIHSYEEEFKRQLDVAQKQEREGYKSEKDECAFGVGYEMRRKQYAKVPKADESKAAKLAKNVGKETPGVKDHPSGLRVPHTVFMKFSPSHKAHIQSHKLHVPHLNAGGKLVGAKFEPKIDPPPKKVLMVPKILPKLTESCYCSKWNGLQDKCQKHHLGDCNGCQAHFSKVLSVEHNYEAASKMSPVNQENWCSLGECAPTNLLGSNRSVSPFCKPEERSIYLEAGPSENLSSSFRCRRNAEAEIPYIGGYMSDGRNLNYTERNASPHTYCILSPILKPSYIYVPSTIMMYHPSCE